MELIHLQIDLQQVLLSCFQPYQLNGRYTHLWVQLGHVLLAASADDSFCLFLPFDGSMAEHFIQYY